MWMVLLSGSNGSASYLKARYSYGDTVTMSGTSNAMYNSDLFNSSHYMIKVSGNSNTIKNNIFQSYYAQALGFTYVNSGLGVDPVFDNNLYYGNSPFLWKTISYNFSDWKTNSSQDVHSVNSDPLFVYFPTSVASWGDSLTYGVGGGGTTYPSVLGTTLGSSIYNRGIGGIHQHK